MECRQNFPWLPVVSSDKQSKRKRSKSSFLRSHKRQMFGTFTWKSIAEKHCVGCREAGRDRESTQEECMNIISIPGIFFFFFKSPSRRNQSTCCEWESHGRSQFFFCSYVTIHLHKQSYWYMQIASCSAIQLNTPVLIFLNLLCILSSIRALEDWMALITTFIFERKGTKILFFSYKRRPRVWLIPQASAHVADRTNLNRQEV